MSYQPQDGRVERATSRWWRTPVASACLRLLALLGFAGVAWLIAGGSTAHADTGHPSEAGQAPVHSTAAADSSAAPATSLLGPVAGPVDRPLATAAAPVAPLAAVAVSPVTGNTSGALAPATTPAAGTRVVNDAVVLVATPARDLVASQAAAAGSRQNRPSPALLGTAALTDPLSVTHGIATSLGMGDAVAPLTTAVRPLTDTTQGVTAGVSSVLAGLPKVSKSLRPIARLPIDGSSAWTGVLPVPATPERTTAPLQSAPQTVSVEDLAGPVELSTVHLAASAAHRSDLASGPAVGADSPAPTLPVPVPGSFPGFPGAALHSGSAAGSSSTQHDGSTGAVGAGGLAARLLASRVLAVTEDSGVTLVRAEDPSVSPD